MDLEGNYQTVKMAKLLWSGGIWMQIEKRQNFHSFLCAFRIV